jgi:hypothetical protein
LPIGLKCHATPRKYSLSKWERGKAMENDGMDFCKATGNKAYYLEVINRERNFSKYYRYGK